MKIFNSIGHFFAWVLHVGLPAVETAASSPLANAIAGVIGSRGTAAQAGLEAIAGDVLKAFDAAGAAVGAEGLNVQFDQATIVAIEALYNDLQSLFGKKPAPPVAAKVAA
jgi:hypothetical protein